MNNEMFCNIDVVEDLNQQLLRLTDCTGAGDLLHPIETDIKPVAYELPRTAAPVNRVVDCIDSTPGSRPVVNPAPAQATTAPIIKSELNMLRQNFANGARIGIDPITISTAATTVVNFFSQFGGDQVPNYPIKTQSTLQKLQAAVAAEFPLPPTSVENAKTLLARVQSAITAKQRESGDAAKTVVMMYQEIATALTNYINAGGGVFTPVAPGSQSTNYPLPGGTLPVAQQPNKLTEFVTNNPVLVLGGIAIGAYLLTRKKSRRR